MPPRITLSDEFILVREPPSWAVPIPKPGNTPLRNKIFPFTSISTVSSLLHPPRSQRRKNTGENLVFLVSRRSVIQTEASPFSSNPSDFVENIPWVKGWPSIIRVARLTMGYGFSNFVGRLKQNHTIVCFVEAPTEIGVGVGMERVSCRHGIDSIAYPSPNAVVTPDFF
jgi:hypothetical protein